MRAGMSAALRAGWRRARGGSAGQRQAGLQHAQAGAAASALRERATQALSRRMSVGQGVRTALDASTAPHTAPAPPRPPIPDSLVGGFLFDTQRLVDALQSEAFDLRQARALSDVLHVLSKEILRTNRDALATKSDFAHLRSELQILEKADFSLLKSDLQLLEKKLETSVANIYTEMERVENRLTKWLVGATSTVIAIVLAFIRLLVPSSPPQPRDSSAPHKRQDSADQFENTPPP